MLIPAVALKQAVRTRIWFSLIPIWRGWWTKAE